MTRCAPQKNKAAFWPPEVSLPKRVKSALTQITHGQVTEFSFVFGLKRNGADRKSQSSGERNGEKLHPHGVASS